MSVVVNKRLLGHFKKLQKIQKTSKIPSPFSFKFIRTRFNLLI